MAGQVLAVASGKGGVGKTTTVVNLGVVLRRADHTVALVDADLGMANLGTMLGISAEVTLHDVLSGSASVEEAIVEEAPGFGVLIGSADLAAYPDAAPAGLGGVLDALVGAYDYVIVDTGAGMSHEDVLPLGLADRVILVTSPDPAAVGDTRKTAELADLARGDIAGVVVTMADESTDADDIATQIGADLLGVVPFDAAVRSSTASATPLEAADPDGAAATAYRELATTIEAGIGTTTEAEDAGDEAAGEAGNADGSAPAATAEDGTDAEPAAEAEEAVPADVAEEPAEAGGAAQASATDDDADEPVEAAENEAEAADDAEPGSDDEEELDDYFEEFEDAEPASSGGFFAKLRRLFR